MYTKQIVMMSLIWAMPVYAHKCPPIRQCPCIYTASGCQCSQNKSDTPCPCIQEKGICECSSKPTNSNIKVEISLGELIDKITILEIKKERFINPNKVRNVETELSLLKRILQKIIAHNPHFEKTILELKEELREINEIMWDIENFTRSKEEQKTFDEDFIEAARAVYLNNDDRAEVKAIINKLLSSYIIEEKEYAPY
ncbi:MAG TPA: DUF6165 family protein [Candidatus Babeliales bacterium]|jgi:hypothetical protein|nr:DUF6165 family protein [Candidatus Babeliales bacterium]